jgi:hypothetical protein
MSQLILPIHRPTRAGRSPAVLRTVVFAAGLTMVCSQAFTANPKKGSKEAAKEAAKEAPKPSAPAIAGPRLPADLNLASMRVKALDVIYELDLSVEQLKGLRAAAAGAASTRVSAAAKGTEKLASTLHEFQGALLERKDDKQIDELRNQIADLANDDDVQLDDGVQITAAARAKAADVLKQLTASQIAAYLAAHADEVGDPVEMMIDTTNHLCAIRATSATGTDDAAGKTAAADTASDAPTEGADLVLNTSLEVGELVGGLDETKAKSVAADVAKWINANSSIKAEEFTAKRKTLMEAARAIVGNIHPMRVLDNWLEHQLASLLSNPQLPEAIDAMIQFKQTAN